MSLIAASVGDVFLHGGPIAFLGGACYDRHQGNMALATY